MGTPDFAVGILDAIYKSNFEIVGVVTAPDKPAGRGQKVSTSAVKEYALKSNLYLLQPTNLKDLPFLEELKKLNATIQVVVAFRMLPEVVWKMPLLGTFNLHASLLPEYRGAAPINWAIINGESKTGVTTFFIDDKIDTGAIILKKETPIYENETVGQLHDRLMNLGKEAVLETLNLVEKRKVKLVMQDDSKALKTAYKLNKENCKIDWSKPGLQIFNLIRGLNPYPAAWTFFNDGVNEWNVKLFEVVFVEKKHNYEIGTIEIFKKELYIYTLDGFLNVKSLQMPGKKKMQTVELLNGIHFSEKIRAK